MKAPTMKTLFTAMLLASASFTAAYVADAAGNNAPPYYTAAAPDSIPQRADDLPTKVFMPPPPPPAPLTEMHVTVDGAQTGIPTRDAYTQRLLEEILGSMQRIEARFLYGLPSNK